MLLAFSANISKRVEIKSSPTFGECNITYIPVAIGGLVSLNSSSAPWRVTSKSPCPLSCRNI